MSNEWFQFRHFLIRQDQSAMKVGTDGVLLGTWADCSNCRAVLDIGTGTGLIALMVAQRNPQALITALEIDPAATKQAKENIQASSWSNRIDVVQADFRTWKPASDQKFDLIVCNPPFFTRSLKNPDFQKATARHDDELPLAGLIPKSAGFLKPEGKLALILPVSRIQEAMAMVDENGLYLFRRMDIRGNINAPVKRVLLEWGRENRVTEISELVIETGIRGIYSEEYRRLTGEFYLGARYLPLH
ncbi:MAG: methyltransferase domain-containing protein [Porphyromonadaceae bacterium]|nr:MAG: methyltransferase domain-containing protein [Porphyromonadaceae bacterium]